MNTIETYEKCKSRELITSFYPSGLRVSYRTMKKHHEDLAKLAISKSEQHIVPLPMNFSKVSFTLTKFDNFDHNDKSATSGTSSTHDTGSVLFKKFPLLKWVNLSKVKYH